jgi:hypothetical protein
MSSKNARCDNALGGNRRSWSAKCLAGTTPRWHCHSRTRRAFRHPSALEPRRPNAPLNCCYVTSLERGDAAVESVERAVKVGDTAIFRRVKAPITTRTQ